MGKHPFGIPMLNKARIGPAGCPDKNFGGTRMRQLFCRHVSEETRGNWLRGRDLNPRPSGYEPDELPGCSTPRSIYANKQGESKPKKS